MTTVVVSSRSLHRTTLIVIILAVISVRVQSRSAKVPHSLFQDLLAPSVSWRRSILQQYYAPANQPTSGHYGEYTPITGRTKTYGSWGGVWAYTSPPEYVGSVAPQVIITPMPSGSSSSSNRLASGTLGATSYTSTTEGAAITANPATGQPTETGTFAPLQAAGPGTFNSNTPPVTTAGSSSSSSSNAPVSTFSSGKGGAVVGATAVPATVSTVANYQPAGAAGSVVVPGAATGATASRGGGVLPAANSNLPAGFTIPSSTVNINAGVVNLPATTFSDAYCVPRQSYIVVNTTAISCNPGSNLTKWDGQPICARIDCEKQLDNGNILVAPSFCRTVVEPPQYYCPRGCDLMTQTLRNLTTNTTQQIVRCACRAGNQPCPGSYIGCVCQPAFITNLNASTSYLVCGSDQARCDSYCSLTANTLGPLCPIQPDATLPGQLSTGENQVTGPVYPRWSWDLASQGQATAAVAPGTPIGRRLLKLRSSSSSSRLNVLRDLGQRLSQRYGLLQAYARCRVGWLCSSAVLSKSRNQWVCTDYTAAA